MRIVDAANVIGSRPDGWWRDRAKAAEKLLQRVQHALDDGRLQGPVVVVLEGRARPASPPATEGSLEVVHAPGSGDDRIVELVEQAAAGGAVPTVVTADRELIRRVHSRGARAQGPRDFLAELEGASGDS